MIKPLSSVYYSLTSRLRPPTGHISKPFYTIYSSLNKYFNPTIYYTVDKITEIKNLNLFYFVSSYLKIKNI